MNQSEMEKCRLKDYFGIHSKEMPWLKLSVIASPARYSWLDQSGSRTAFPISQSTHRPLVQ
jgi:hypothetical protein